MAFALVTFTDGSVAALKVEEYCALDMNLVRSVKIVGSE